ncbi:MAG TPA: DUF6151 family protein [Myxococcaceae bacterium]|nr:DUF6151 family protein [Myxococcaceae bacterium]
MTSTTLPFRCRCGEVRGTLADLQPTSGIRVVCHCRSCRTWAERLDRADLLDAAGGTDLVQTAPSRLRFETGHEALRCVKLTEKGVLRWFTACCRTPIANTPDTPSVPIMGFFVGILGGEPHTLQRVLGPVRYRLQGADAVGTPPPGTKKAFSTRHMLQASLLMLRFQLTRRVRPTPFFDDAGRPVAPILKDPSEAA